ncbi:MAG: hypothetical protein AAF799_40405 [Myxococcota bacterium]
MPARQCIRLGLALVLGLAAAACNRPGRGGNSPDGPVSDMEANRYIRRAIRQSSEGVILLPSQRAERVYELPRLNEIAQGLRSPAARCFLARAIETMERRTDGERGYLNVPEGQIKARVRIAPSGEVLRAEILESGFKDEQMEPCLQEVLVGQRWPPNKSGNAHYIDVIYWVSLGFQRGLDTEEMAVHMRREEVSAGRRGKACLQGRVDAGRYEVSGLNLIDREGRTLVNRVETGDLPEPIRACIATALREIRLPRDPDAFVRPLSPTVTFDITGDGTITVVGERWLELIEMEERAQLAAERDALRSESEEPYELVDELPSSRPSELSTGAVAVGERLAEETAGEQPVEPDPNGQPPPAVEPPNPGAVASPAPTQDPGKGGLRLKLGSRGEGDDS